ncbi:DJ-1/PfpI family protein [Streptomyces sp. NPDC050704]|uniref:DJ-1/PfpI family protein n=1 Tax=Streptomyces sp. NPDC050704 TaxID=3157219 RepID=UPI0034162FB0
MAKLLMIVTSARLIRLADGKDHPTGYFVEEVLEPYETFAAAGGDLVIATLDGRSPQPDPWGLEPYFHYPQVDEDFMFSVLRRFAYHPDRVRVTFTHFSELNLVALRGVYLALLETGMEPAQARGAVESAGQRAWRRTADLIELLVADAEMTSRLPVARIREIGDRVQQASRTNARRVVEALAAIPGLQRPCRLGELTDEEILSCDGVFFPGGHGPMVDMADNAEVGRVLRLMHDAGKIIAALCHGPAALLSAPEVDGAWLFDGYKMTAFTDEEEHQTKPGRVGLPWSLEAALKSRGAIFDDGDAPWASHVVIDRNLITGQNVGSSEAAACALLSVLEGGTA